MTQLSPAQLVEKAAQTVQNRLLYVLNAILMPFFMTAQTAPALIVLIPIKAFKLVYPAELAVLNVQKTLHYVMNAIHQVTPLIMT